MTMSEFIYTTTRILSNGHKVERTITERQMRNTETNDRQVVTTTTFNCACGRSEYEGSLSIAAFEELHEQLMEAAQ